MHIDDNATLTARHEILIDAPITSVWAIQTAIEQWPQWQPDITAATLEGPLAVGTVFRWKAKGLGIVSTLQAVEEPTTIGWTGDSLGMHAVHIWHFSAEGNQTRVKTEESLAGWMVRLLKLFDRNFLEKSLKQSLATLKNRVEEA